MSGYTANGSLFQTTLPPIRRGIQKYNCSFSWTGKNKKIDVDKKHRKKKKKKATLHKMANLDNSAMLHMTLSHNTEGDGDMEGRIQPGGDWGYCCLRQQVYHRKSSTTKSMDVI